jgi:hypothetical protein
VRHRGRDGQRRAGTLRDLTHPDAPRNAEVLRRPAAGPTERFTAYPGPNQGILEGMLAMLLGSLATIGTVTVLAWDWWRHPTL